MDDGKGRLVTAAGGSPEIEFEYTDKAGAKRTAGHLHGPHHGPGHCARVIRRDDSGVGTARSGREFRAELKSKLDRLLPFQVGKRGRMQCEQVRNMPMDRIALHRHIFPGHSCSCPRLPTWNGSRRSSLLFSSARNSASDRAVSDARIVAPNNSRTMPRSMVGPMQMPAVRLAPALSVYSNSIRRAAGGGHEPAFAVVHQPVSAELAGAFESG